MQPIFFTMMGFPGAGKSTFARQLAAQMHIVRLSSDALRAQMFAEPDKSYNAQGYAELFGAMDYAASEIIRAGQSVIYDAKCNRLAERRKNAALAEDGGGAHVTIWVKLPLDESLTGTIDREESDGAQRFDEARRALHTNDKLDEPQAGEPAIVINGREPFETQYESFREQLASLV